MKLSNLHKNAGNERVNMAQISKKKFKKCPNFAKYLIFGLKPGKKTIFREI